MFDGWLSQIMALLLKPHLIQTSKHLNTSFFNQSALMPVCGEDFMTFLLTISTQRSWNRWDLCIGYHLYYILSNHHQNIPRISEDASCWTIRKRKRPQISFNFLVHFTASMAPLQIFFNNGIDGKEKSFCKILYDCIEVYRNSIVYRITLVEYTALFLNLYSRSSSNMLPNFSVCDIK